ncbi:MAG TPA: hypothetical protein VF412_04675 [Bdellovibrio sp.]|uniref:Crp/Fnr family transcriptional regulator n=1 Tax=Bdellovibrio sp. TaxID=28201 RepID=UPI002EDCD1CF
MTFPELQQFFSQYSDIPPEEWTDFSTFVRTQFISRDESFISLGDTNGHIGFVVKGLFRVCYIDSDGGRFIRNFCAEGTLISAYTEALQEKPAEIEIQAIEH